MTAMWTLTLTETPVFGGIFGKYFQSELAITFAIIST